MNVLSVHNFYKQPGGEDEVFRQEARLLEKHGHQVVLYHAHNNDVDGKSPFELVYRTIFNLDTYRHVRKLIRDEKPNIIHVHNTFPLLSPSVYYAAAREGVPVVQTIHNYRFLCPAGTLYRENNLCERCLDSRSMIPAIRHGCYRGKAATAAAATMLTLHRKVGTYKKRVITYIALSDFARLKYIQGGIPADRLVVKPNFIDPDPGKGRGTGNYCMFVGRLTAEKGITTMLEAWKRFSLPFDLEIAGDGDLAPEVASAAQQCPRIRWLGRMEKAELYTRMRNATALVVPSTWYEPFGMVVVEAFAMGLPVVASKIGALSDLIDHRRTGLHFSHANPADLASQISWLHSHPQALKAMREAARSQFNKCYTGEVNYKLLMNIYKTTIDRFETGELLSGESVTPATGRTQAFVQIGS